MVINRDYTRLWAGQAVSLVGDHVFDTTVVLWVGTVLFAGDRLAPVAVAAVLATVAAVTFLVGPVAGVFVDRWDRRRTMLVTDTVRGLLVGGLALLAFLPVERVPRGLLLGALLALVALVTAGAQFFNPARFAYLGDVVPEAGDRARAAAVGQATLGCAALVGPPLAAPLLFTVGPGWALVLDALTFAVSALAIGRVRVPSALPAGGEAPGFRREFGAGLRFFRATPVLRAALVSVLLVTVGSGTLGALGVFFVPENLGAPASWYGVLGMSLSVGTLAGALWAGRLCARFGPHRVFAGGLVLAGAAVVVYSRASSLPVAAAVLVLAGAPLGALNTAFGPIVLDAAPSAYLGRVMAVFTPLQRLAELVGVTASGFLAGTVMAGFHRQVLGVRFGRIDTLYLAAGLLVLAGGLYALRALSRGGRETAV
ncbi:MFS transporter [Kitasatospora sp. NPDC088134]|uniref:MFS transporter n=1 Tax=Kitasatospora sp. NPDC088134 TaxID=3364071 RepID=UPI0037F5D3A9